MTAVKMNWLNEGVNFCCMGRRCEETEHAPPPGSKVSLGFFQKDMLVSLLINILHPQPAHWQELSCPVSGCCVPMGPNWLLPLHRVQRSWQEALTSHERVPRSGPIFEVRGVLMHWIPLYLNPDQVARKANELEQFLLCKFKTKKVILKKDMLEIIGAELEEHFDEILKKASVGIEMEFAVKVMEVDPVIHSFDLVSKIKLPNNGRLRPGQGLPKTGLLMNILGIILLKGNRATEEDLWKYLGKMKVFPGRKHSLYGEPRKLITIDLVRLNYLVYRQIPKSDPPRFEFLWGPKAYAETSKKQVIEFLATIIGHEPSVLLAQFKDLLKEEDK
ncbi:melanoma-associated antigen B5-like [Suncus etruscus]|uniref:melanoma-associated antigen B5-like n=1 Tax=Suncus etruscus TaxID=109475 RepID=UPI0021108FDC|nr:melanoma-associated antigen B5-like [Suncus etruscus]